MADDPTTGKSGSDDIDDIDVELVDDGDDLKNDPTDDPDGDDPVNDDDTVTPDDDPEDDKSKDNKTPAFDDDLDEWAEKAGHDKPENDRERKLLQGIRNGSREFTREQQSKAAKGLAKSIKDATPKSADDETVIDPLEKEVRDMNVRMKQIENTRLMSEYLSEQRELGTPLTSEEQEAMAAVLQEAADRGDMKTFEVLTDGNNLRLWRAAGRERLAETTDVDKAVAEKARKEERERLAKASKAGGPSRDAHAKTSGTKKDEIEAIWDDDSI